MISQSDSKDDRAFAEATRILVHRSRMLEKEVKDLYRECDRQPLDCLADTATLLISGQRLAGLICPEIEQRIINGVEERHPYDLLIKGSVIRKYFSPGKDLNPVSISTDDALVVWSVFYHIEFKYYSGSDTYHFIRR